MLSCVERERRSGPTFRPCCLASNLSERAAPHYLDLITSCVSMQYNLLKVVLTFFVLLTTLLGKRGHNSGDRRW